jgi:hypothetical protein
VSRVWQLGSWWKDCCMLVVGNKVSSSSAGAVSATSRLLTFFVER